MAVLRASIALTTLGCTLAACASPSGTGENAGAGGAGAGGAGAGGAGASGVSVSSSATKPDDHDCFATEATCDGKCVNLDENPDHCGACGSPCTAAFDQTGQCVEGGCVYACNDGFIEDQGHCKNLFGAHEAFPADCQGCSTANPTTGACSCPSTTSELSLAVQSDCPGVPLRSATRWNLCVTPGASEQSDFGGAYQVDDLDGWCGATAQCRVGNPLAGGACACPPGLDDAISLRSIIRLPCDSGEVGSTVVICGNKDVPIRSFGGAFQVDDLEPTCRVVNPWTGACSCPEGTSDHVFRVMVDGPAGLYGSTFHLCTP
jgi:hypothetical protein